MHSRYVARYFQYIYRTSSLYHIAQNFGGVKLWRTNSFTVLERNNVDEFTIAIGIWLGKILVNDVHFAKFTKVFSCQNFALYSIISTAKLLNY